MPGYVNHPDAFLSLAFPVMGLLPVSPSSSRNREESTEFSTPLMWTFGTVREMSLLRVSQVIELEPLADLQFAPEREVKE
jgi:hypothetical protein